MEKNSAYSNRERIIKYLNSSLKNLEEENLEFEELIENNDASNALCWSIEAVFLHGLKSSKPNKDFWTLLKKCSHKSTLESIRLLNQIKSDVGRCRAWLRLSINECCLESYMSIITNDASMVGRYYLPSAFLLDAALTNAMMRSIQSLSNYHFKLSCNSTVLNQWNQPPLQLAGIVSATNLKWPQLKKGAGNKPGVSSSLSSSHSNSGSSSPSIVKPAPANHKRESNAPNKHVDGLGISSSQSVESLDRKKLKTEVFRPQSFSDSLDKDNTSESSSTSHPDFQDARQEFYRTVYDISESEEDEAARRTGGADAARAAEERTMENDRKFMLIVKNNLDKFPLNYDQNLSVSLKQDSDFVSEMMTRCSSSYSSTPVQGAAGLLQVIQPSSLKDRETTKPAFAQSFSPVDRDIKSSNFQPMASSCDDATLLNSRLDAEGLVSKQEGNGRLMMLASSRSPMGDHPTSDVAAGDFTAEEGQDSEVFLCSSTDDGMITVEKIIQSVMGKKGGEPKKEEVSPMKKKRHALHEAKNKEMDIMGHYTSIKHERGLASQCFQCKDCSAPIGMLFGRERLCSFDKCYYCPDCLDKDESVIPSKVIFNWDFRPYKVSKKNHEYLTSNKLHPLINLDVLNPALYDHVPVLGDVKTARLKLKYLKSYLLSCDLNLVIELHSFVGGLSYYTENIHLYSMEDLMKVPSSQLLRMMNKAFNFGVFHINSCLLCSQKGFYCEICRADSIIYPFNLENTTRCDSCRAVYHKTCKTSGKACPKCQRRAVRNSTSFSAVEGASTFLDVESRPSYSSQDSINFTYAAAVGS